MGKRSGVAETEKEVAGLGVLRLNVEIARSLQGFEDGGTSQGRQGIFQASRMVGDGAGENTRDSSHAPPLACKVRSTNHTCILNRITLNLLAAAPAGRWHCARGTGFSL
jgi:hypothetical protein